MILRAIFWIGLVAILIPHEPDLGLGRPASPGTHLLSGMSAALKERKGCEGKEAACTPAVGLLDRLKFAGIHRLAEVKAEIEQAERARGG